MAQISRLHEAEIANGNLINADDLDDEFNQLVSEDNAADLVLTAIATGNYTFSGTKTFSSTPKMNAIDERSAATGVTIDSVLLKDGMAQVAGIPDANGKIGYDTNQFKGYRNGSLKTFLMNGDVGYPTGYRGSATPKWASDTTITLANIKERSSDDTVDIFKTTSTTLDITGTGLNKLDAGTVTTSAWYYPYSVTNGTTYGLMASLINEAATGTISSANYAYTAKRQLEFAFYVDASGHIAPFFKIPGTNKIIMDVDPGSSPWLLLSGGTASSFTDLDCSAMVPGIAVSVELNGYAIHNSLSSYNWGFIRPGGSSSAGRIIAYTGAPNNSATPQGINISDVMMSSSKIIQYKAAGINGPALTLGVAGFTVEVN